MATAKKTAKPKTAKKTAKSGGAPKWESLTAEQKIAVYKRMFATYKRGVKFAAGCYNIVGSASHTRLRQRAVAETGCEDDALTTTLRNQFVNLSRNGVRNNETLNAILLQFKLNVIGTVGGKAYFDFGEKFEDDAKILKREFSEHCASCEYFDGGKFSDFLEQMLVTLAIGGDVVVAFDNHTFENSGKLIGYEPDSIANLSDDLAAKLLPDGVTQRNGRLYSRTSRFMGAIVSSSERGKSTFENEKSVHIFSKDPNASRMDCDWIMVGCRWRWNQGRGVSPLTAPLGSFIDVDTLQGFEIEAGKLNAQMCAQVYQTQSDEESDPLPSPDLAATEFDAEALDAAAADAAEDSFAEAPPSFKELEAAGVCWNLMPANSKMELLDTKHPNPNMNEFIRLVAARGGWANGLASCFVTGKVDSSYSGYRGEQLMTWPAFQRWQKMLEDFCDWHFRRWYEWAKITNAAVREIAPRLPENLFELVEWEWPIMREVNAVDEQNALNMGLKNGSITYRDKFGPSWKRKLAQAAYERKICGEIKFPHPADETVSGQLINETKGTNE
jgi:hypothetical protein